MRNVFEIIHFSKFDCSEKMLEIHVWVLLLLGIGKKRKVEICMVQKSEEWILSSEKIEFLLKKTGEMYFSA